MKKKIYLPIILLMTLFCNSCIDEAIVGEEGIQKDKLHLRITTADPQIIETRTSTDNAIQNVYVLIFSGTEDSSTLLGMVQASSSDSQNFYANLESKENGQMYVIANAASNIGNLKGSWAINTTTLEQVKKELLLSFPQSDDGYITSDEIAEASPMMADVAYTGTTTSYEVTLTRTTAKVSVVNSSNNARYKLLGANAGNAPVSGYIFSGMTTSANIANYAGQGNDGKYSPESMMKGMEEVDPATPSVTPTPPTTKPLYLFESVASNKTFVIIKGEYNGVVGYHKLNIWKNSATTPVEKEFIALERNYHYKVQINKIYTTGYKTAKEAIDNAAAANSDISYDIDITDGVSCDIVTNGRYYLGLTNTEYLLYHSEELSGVEIATVATNATGDASPGTLEVKVTEGTGSIVCNNPFVAANDGKVHITSIIPTIPATVLKAEFILRVGDLAQTIRFERISNSLAFGGCMELPQGYAYAKIVDKTTKWASFVESESATVETGTQEYFNRSGKNSKLYLAYSSNLIFTNDPATPSSSKQTDALLFKADDGGHTRMRLVQAPFDIFNQTTNPEGYIKNPYVGAFWRYNQTGERVIKMNAITSKPEFLPQLTWTATVVVGQSWTRLQSGGSSDPTIYTSKPTLGSDLDFENSYQLTEKTKTTVSGDGENVTFRIGLMNTITSAEHRYGLIIVATYLAGKQQNTYRIFTRQGEAPDYVFRKDDPVSNPKWVSPGVPRPLAARISPFNLTDPGLRKGELGQQYKFHNPMPLDYQEGSDTYHIFNENKFTKYPSQAGYLFIWNAEEQGKEVSAENRWIRAVHPINFVRMDNATKIGVTRGGDPITGSEAINDYSGSYSGNGDGNTPRFDAWSTYEGKFSFTQIGRMYNKKTEPCPYGYRYPSIGKIVDGGNTIYQADNAINSELLQSMFYDPYITNTSSDKGSYTAWGYYADGFFDRLKIAAAQSHTAPTWLKPKGQLTGTGEPNTTVYYGATIAANNQTTDIANLTGNDIGYIGGLIFNPYNYASLFNPAVGGSTDTGTLLTPGTKYAYAGSERVSTASAESSNYPIVLYSSKSGNSLSFVLQDMQGVSNTPRTVRCVRDKDITITGHDAYK